MWSSWAESAKSSVTQALEKTGDALSKAAANTQGGKTPTPVNGSAEETVPTIPSEEGIASTTSSSSEQQQQSSFSPHPTIAVLPPPQQQQQQEPQQHRTTTDSLFSHSFLSQGWSNVVETTRASMKHAELQIKEQHSLLQERLHQAARNRNSTSTYKRDPTLPLDVDALKDAEVVYITDRLITMGHPAMASQVDGDISGERKLAAVGHLLNRRHDGRFMVWNLSEVDYDVDVLDDQVLSFTFAGSPSPPLGLLLKLLVSMESWLKADDRNVAVVHCLTGKGRTSAVLAAFLCWMGQAQFADVFDALNYIAQCKQVSVDELTIPSQRRYASYFKNMLDGVRPSQPPLMLKRVIMSEAPRFAKGPPRPPPPSSNNNNNSEMETDETQLFGCVPYLQIFKAGALLHTAPASLHYQQPVNELPFCQVADGNISFHVNLVIQGDILVRARHLTHNKKRVSMFRAAFHTGYTPPNVMRFTKAQLDGACSDDRFAPDFFLDFIFEPVDAEEASKLLNDDAGNNKNKPYETSAADATTTASSDKRKANAVEASADDTMLHRDSRFWEVIATRMKENAAETVKQEDPMWGPTVGRRRDFSIKDDGTGQAETNATTSEQARNALETFSIGGEFDFLPEITEPGKPIALATAVAAPKKDSLMEALMGALDDDMHDHEADKEETVEFDTGDSPSLSAVQSNSESADESLKLSDKPSELQEESIHGGSSSVDKESNATPAVDDVQALLADANINLDGMDALLAEAGGTDFEEDDDMLNFDVDDEDLKDLEHFLSPSST